MLLARCSVVASHRVTDVNISDDQDEPDSASCVLKRVNCGQLQGSFCQAAGRSERAPSKPFTRQNHVADRSSSAS